MVLPSGIVRVRMDSVRSISLKGGWEPHIAHLRIVCLYIFFIRWNIGKIYFWWGDPGKNIPLTFSKWFYEISNAKITLLASLFHHHHDNVTSISVMTQSILTGGSHVMIFIVQPSQLKPMLLQNIDRDSWCLLDLGVREPDQCLPTGFDAAVNMYTKHHMTWPHGDSIDDYTKHKMTVCVGRRIQPMLFNCVALPFDFLPEW